MEKIHNEYYKTFNQKRWHAYYEKYIYPQVCI